METRVVLEDSIPPQTIRSIVATLKSIKLKAFHDCKDWGDWITFSNSSIVISIESVRGLTSSATIELENEDDEAELENQVKILTVFSKLGWKGVDQDGIYIL